MEYGLIGEHLTHSFSKLIHEQICTYEYTLYPLSKAQLDQFMKEKNFKAINVTIPYKKDVIPYLDEIDENAKTIGAVNTIVNQNGILHGYNTDYDGFLYMITQHNVKLNDKKVLILGNGGASAAIQAVIKKQNPSKIIIVSPSAKNGAISFNELYEHHRDVQVIVNTSPNGMYPNNHDQPINLDDFTQCEQVIDIIYNPIITALGVQAKSKNIPFVGGLEMLIAQAIYAIHHFTQQPIQLAKIQELYQKIMFDKLSIALIGMPSCGKTTVAKSLSTLLNKNYIDIDEKIVNHCKSSIPEIFKNQGEAKFREIETSITLEIAKQEQSIISCGGGIILNEKNMHALAQNCIIVYIKRDLDLLICDNNRPLSTDKEAIMKLYKKRKHLYEQYADFVVMNNNDINTCINEIVKKYHSYITTIL